MSAWSRVRNLLMLALIGVLLVGCAANSGVVPPDAGKPTVLAITDGEPEDEVPIEIYDPWEGWNRRVYLFNARFDQVVFLPVVDTYEFLVPEPARDSIDNFFSNLDNLITFANQVLQGKIMGAAQTAFRFVTNATVGVLGLFDPATAIDVPQHKEDFGQTLGVWGVGEGPYMVLPILGPSNLRDSAGFATDAVAFSVVDPFGASSFQTEYPPVLATNIINRRAQVDFRYYQTGSPFEYDLVRFLYTKKRQLDVAK